MQMLVNIDVDDLERAIAFYCAAFELSVGRCLGIGAVELLGAPVPIYLLLKRAGSAPSRFTRQTRDYHRHWSPVHLDFVVPDIASAVDRAVAAGATLEQPVSVSSWGKLALCADPFGHGFCFVEFIGRGYDEIAQQDSSSVA